MNADPSDLSPTSMPQETLLLLAREQEWAEAYSADHPACELGHVYLRFLRAEIVVLMDAL